MPCQHDAVLRALTTLDHPVLGQSLGELGVVRDVAVREKKICFTFDFTRGSIRPSDRHRHPLASLARKALAALDPSKKVQIRWQEEVPGRAEGADDPLPLVKNIVLVMSGKGGVGKSTVTTHLALALHQGGYRVGLLDADIYGPSIPTMFGVRERPFSLDGKTIEPIEKFGIKLMSIGFLLQDPKSPLIWRGPMLHGALQQLLRDVNWGEIDYLFLDLPPGTGDVALTLAQRLEVNGAVVVTTPQAVATDDVFKSVSMCKKVDILVLGVVENMSCFVDTAMVRHYLFGRGGGEAVAQFAQAPLLGQIPVEPSLREGGDRGVPLVQSSPFAPVATLFVEMAEKLLDRLSVVRRPARATRPFAMHRRADEAHDKKHLPLVK